MKAGDLRAALVLLTITCNGVPVPSVFSQSESFTQLADGVYANTVSPEGSAVSNSGIVIFENFVLVFDTHFTPEAAQSLLGRIRTVTQKPIRYVVNSHFHPDHTHGNQVFANAHQILGTTATRRDMLEKDIPAMRRTTAVAQSQLERLQKDLAQESAPQQKSRLQLDIRGRQQFIDRMTKLQILVPVFTFVESLVIAGESRRAELLHLGRGHTDGDLILYLPDEKVVFTGDLFFNDAIPNTQDAFLLDWIRTLNAVQKLDVDKFVPGHGPIGDRGDIRRFQAYLEELRSLVEPGVKRGDSLEKVLSEVQLPPSYSSYKFQNFFPSNVQRMYYELKQVHESPLKESRPD